MGQNAVGQSDCRIFKSTISLEQKLGVSQEVILGVSQELIFGVLIQIQES